MISYQKYVVPPLTQALDPSTNTPQQIFSLLGLPTTTTWPSFTRLPNARTLRLPPNPNPTTSGPILRSKFPLLTTQGTALLSSLLALNPASRPTASQVLAHPYFKEDPKPAHASLFPTFPSKANQEKRRRVASPSAPKRGDAPALGGLDFGGIFSNREAEERGGGFALRLV